MLRYATLLFLINFYESNGALKGTIALIKIDTIKFMLIPL